MNTQWKNSEGKLTGTAKAVIISGAVLVLAIAAISGTAAGNTPAAAPSAATHDTATTTPAPVEAPAETPTPTPTPEKPKAPDGKTLATAGPAGSVLTATDYSGQYTIQFGTVNWSADAVIKAANMFNDPAPAGQKYIMVPVTIQNTGTSEVSPGVIMLHLAFVTDDGRSFQQGASVVLPNDTLSGANLYAGTTITGNVAIPIPAEINTGAFAIGGAFVRAN